MAKRKKNQRVALVTVNKYRRIALFLNPIVLVILVLCLFFHVPLEGMVAIGVVGYAAWFFFFLKASAHDKNLHGK